MKLWDLNTGNARLEEAVESLQLAWAEATEHWDDQAAAKFQQSFLEPLEPRVRRAQDAVRRLMQVLERAHRECSDVQEL